MKNGSKIKAKLGVADAHPNGNRPFKREDYINKFKILTSNIIDNKESKRFLSDVQNLRKIGKADLHKLNIEIESDFQNHSNSNETIFWTKTKK